MVRFKCNPGSIALSLAVCRSHRPARQGLTQAHCTPRHCIGTIEFPGPTAAARRISLRGPLAPRHLQASEPSPPLVSFTTSTLTHGRGYPHCGPTGTRAWHRHHRTRDPACGSRLGAMPQDAMHHMTYRGSSLCCQCGTHWQTPLKSGTHTPLRAHLGYTFARKFCTVRVTIPVEEELWYRKQSCPQEETHT